MSEDISKGVIHQYWAKVKVHLGCYKEQFLSIRATNQKQNGFYEYEPASNTLRLAYAFTNFKITIDLNNFVEIFSDIQGCGAYKLSLVSSSSSSIIQMISNPTLKDLATGAFKPEISFSF